MDATGSTGKAARDFIVLTLLLAGANHLLGQNDPGWLGLNPTPWLIPSMLVGIRYGFIPGLLTGLVTSAGVALAVSQKEVITLAEALHLHSYHMLALVVAGAVAGEAGSILGKSRRALAQESAQLSEENTRLHSQLQIINDTRHQLQQRLAVYNAPLCPLDEDLARIFNHPPEQFNTQLLHALHRATGMVSAAIYEVRDHVLHQLASLHPTTPLKESLLLTATPLAEKALAAQALASVPDATELTQAQPFLAAFPWMDGRGHTCVLLIQDMPLESYTLQNLARLELIISWASALAALRQDFTRHSERGANVSHQEFSTLLSEAINTDQTHGIPSIMLRIDPPATGTPIRRKSVSLPSTAITAQLADENALAVLLPFSGQAEAAGLSRALVQTIPGARIRHHVVSGESSAEDLWQLLQQAS
ncbi:hypothetical protein DES53_101310 [Roseimicrobium gellanilyticum]|uniref:PelD-like GGDEF domain-containing protein n=1 Tax=Roseimicrobium gellanilyticum TaxID=748857 RepID=A0A366HTA8_9BACT|nr:hypothetical protein [Roseimicrobium gellanilyticum]RBP47513.1 hypothetical protein DES53_101310 [Roseimicrobium gellanilyticum]